MAGSSLGPGNPITTPPADGVFADLNLANIVPTTDVDFNSQKIVDVANPTNPQDVVTLDYFDNNAPAGSADVDLGNILPTASVDFNAQKLSNVANPTVAQDVVTLDYFDNNVPAGVANLDLSNILPTTDVDFNSQKLINVANPTNAQDVVTLDYYDNNAPAGLALINLSNILPSADVDFNSQKLINVANPTNPQDVVTLDYFDNNPGSGANTALSNLISPTAINQDLVFGALVGTWTLQTNDNPGGNTAHIYVKSGDGTGTTGDVLIESGAGIVGTGNIDIITGLTGGTRGIINMTGQEVFIAAPDQVSLNGSIINYNLRPNKDHVWESGDTASRPAVTTTGLTYFDTDLGIPIWYDGVNWVNATGTTV